MNDNTMQSRYISSMNVNGMIYQVQYKCVELVPEGELGPNGSVDEFLQLGSVVDVDRFRKGVARIQSRLQRASVSRHNLTNTGERRE